ncbi:hypothetical protein ACQ3I4_10505 [Zafaria sp. Z1313]|nr:hypothetical protein [Zafaria sp. J156]MEE1620564.1 hypothetical protein [Zafaria sp. J156]
MDSWIFWIIAGGLVAVGSAVVWGRRTFRHEIDRARRIRRSRRNGD